MKSSVTCDSTKTQVLHSFFRASRELFKLSQSQLLNLRPQRNRKSSTEHVPNLHPQKTRPSPTEHHLILRHQAKSANPTDDHPHPASNSIPRRY